jgi:TPP-dependent pyruvate/acetoin dehydrogenase alpha subunit
MDGFIIVCLQVFSLMNQDGTLKDESESSFPSFSPDEWRAVYKKMIGLKSMDDVFLASQRQGRISFYSTSF